MVSAYTEETSLELELVLGLPAIFWLDLERNYQLTQKRINGQRETSGGGRSPKEVPSS